MNPPTSQLHHAQPPPPSYPPPATGFPVQDGYHHNTGPQEWSTGLRDFPVYNSHHYRIEPQEWSTGLCDCSSDIPTCCITYWCPCITFGKIAEIVDKGTTSCLVSGSLYTLICCLTGCGCIYSCIYRNKMRQQYMLKDTPCCDCFLHWCCESCALCQEYRELQNRGFDMTLGWDGNIARGSRGVVMAPTAPGVEYMTR